MSTADKWVTCRLGHSHWGAAGAAGLLLVKLVDDEPHYLLQHRSRRVHHGGTWGIPGGAIGYQETATQGAFREAAEELGPLPTTTLLAEHPDHHGGWTYTTVAALLQEDEHALDAPGRPHWEVGPGGHSWAPGAAVDGYELHPGLEASWPSIRRATYRSLAERSSSPRTR